LAILAVGANAGIGSAAADTHVAPKHKTHHVSWSHRRDLKRHHAKHLHAKPAHKKQPVAHAADISDPTSSAGTPQPAGIPGNWNLKLDSEFSGSSLDTSVWRTGWYGSGVTAGVGGTSEHDCDSPDDVSFPGDGTMHLGLTKTSSTCDGISQPYTTGLVTTDPTDGRSGGGFTYTYGVAEARIYIPAAGNQIADWPSFWADGTGTWPETGEDDVLEGLGGKACFHFHSPLGGPGDCDSSITPGWHTFASDWQPGSVTYYYDGKDVGSITTGITSAPMYLILGNGVSSTPGDTVADSMQVQYVRVWQD